MRARQVAAAIAALCLIGGLAASAHGAGEPAFGCKKVHRGKAEIDPNPRDAPRSRSGTRP